MQPDPELVPAPPETLALTLPPALVNLIVAQVAECVATFNDLVADLLVRLGRPLRLDAAATAWRERP